MLMLKGHAATKAMQIGVVCAATWVQAGMRPSLWMRATSRSMVLSQMGSVLMSTGPGYQKAGPALHQSPQRKSCIPPPGRTGLSGMGIGMGELALTLTWGGAVPEEAMTDQLNCHPDTHPGL